MSQRLNPERLIFSKAVKIKTKIECEVINLMGKSKLILTIFMIVS